MTETADSVWQLVVNEPEISIEEAVDNMTRTERDDLKRNCSKVYHAIRTKEIMEEFYVKRD